MYPELKNFTEMNFIQWSSIFESLFKKDSNVMWTTVLTTQPQYSDFLTAIKNDPDFLKTGPSKKWLHDFAVGFLSVRIRADIEPTYQCMIEGPSLNNTTLLILVSKDNEEVVRRWERYAQHLENATWHKEYLGRRYQFALMDPNAPAHINFESNAYRVIQGNDAWMKYRHTLTGLSLSPRLIHCYPIEQLTPTALDIMFSSENHVKELHRYYHHNDSHAYAVVSCNPLFDVLMNIPLDEHERPYEHIKTLYDATRSEILEKSTLEDFS